MAGSNENMLIKSNSDKEKEIVQILTESNEELCQQHELFLAEMEFKQKLIDTRKSNSITQQEVSERSGLSQQAVSRLEKGTGGTLETVMRYLHAIGYSLEIKRIL
ncbi:MAG: helix-turn-helix transcriptional regulator [bacterium]|nr:helix-turn-helix transcriptional regulator [bacterium]